ncbi:choice-of-anchor G family protein, partial [Frigoribacterium faeni]|uniref:choice-of-anchor G family protein n=1 Tax=Frigoribacterium faeni TaxID=145483 RepID=UPI0024135B88
MRSQTIERPRRSHASRALKATAAAVVAAVVGALVVVVPAQAATTDRSEAEASLVGGTGIVALDQVAALGGAYSAFGTTQNPPTSRNPLNLTAVNALTVGLGNGIRLLGGNGLLTLGVDGQYANATATGATASAGLIAQDGSIAVGDGSPAQQTTLRLQPLLAQVPATQGVLSDVTLQLGALSSQITQQRGATATTPTTAYQVAGAEFTLTSPAVQGVTSSLRSTVGGLGTAVNGVAGSTAVSGLANSITGPLTTAVNGLPLGGAVTLGQPTVNVQAAVDLDSTISAELARPLTSGPVTIIPSTGQVVIDLDALNGLPANTDLLRPATITAITAGITDILQNQLPTNLVAAVDDAIRATQVTVDLAVALRIQLAVVGVNETLSTRTVTTLGALLDGTVQPAATTVTGSGLVGALGATVLRGALLPVVGTLLGSVGGLYSPLVDGTALAATTTSLRTTTAAVVTTLAPLTTLLNQLVRVTINAQDSAGFRDGRGTDAGSSSVHAVSLSVLPLVNASRVDLATSTVRAAALAPLSIATPTAGQVFVVPASPGATRSVVLTGAGEPGATVTVDLGAGLTGTGTVAADGSWSVTVANVPAGAYSASVTQALGTATTGPVTRDFTVVAQQPLVVTTPTAGRVFTVLDADSTTPVIVSGTATPTATVAVDLGGGRTATALVAADGTWSTTVPGVPVGGYTASVTQALGGDVSAAVTRAFSVVAGTGLTITSPTSGTQYRLPGADSTRDVTVSGAGQAGAPVAVTLGGGRDLTTTVAPNGTWSVTFPALPVATYTATATQTVGGAVSAPQTTDFTLVAATGVTISTPTPGATLTVADATSTTPVTVTGAAEPNAPVRVDLGDGYVATTTADATGAWSATVSSVPVGPRTISVTQTVAGVVSVPVTQPLTVAAGAPLDILAPAEGTTVRVADSASLSTLTVSGTAQVGADVRVDLGDGLTGRITADATTGAWSVDVDGVPVGQRTISATQTVGGTVSPAQTRVVSIVAGTPVAISTPAPGATIPIVGGTTADVTVTGTADPGATVTVGLGAGFEVPATVDPATGAWTAVIPDVPAGVRTLGATQTLGGTTSAPVTQPLTIAQGTPLAVTAPLDGAEYFVPGPQDTTPVVVSGTGQVGATVEVDLGDGLVGQVVVPVSGQWSVAVVGVPVGPHTVSVTQSINGSTSDAVTRDVLVSVGGDVVITAPVPGTQLVVADDQGTAPVTIAGTGVAGLPVTVTVDGVDQAPVATDAQGAWSLVLTGVAVGDHVVGASQQQGPDLLEAEPTDFSVVSAEADLSITAPGDGDVVTVAGADSTTAVVVTGTAYPGASVEVTLAGVVVPTTAGPDGLWSVTVPGVPVGDQVASATQTVGGTTTTEPVTRAFEIVSGADVVITTPAADIRYVVASPAATQDVPVAGTAQPGARITVTLDGAEVGSTLADPVTGAWAVTLVGVGVGERVLGASQAVRDTVQQADTRVVTIDPAAPLTIVAPADGVPIVLADPSSTTTLVVSGQAEPGAVVRVDLGDGFTDTVTSGTTTGAWTVSFAGVPVGTRTVTATQTVGTSVSAPETRVVRILAGDPLVVLTPADGSVVDVAGPEVVTTVTVSGTAAAGATVDVVLDPATGADLAATTTADAATGRWSVDVPGVPVGAADLSVTQSIGGTTSPAQESSFEIRAAAPVVIVDPDDTVFTVLDPAGTVDVPVSGTASPGAPVSVRLNGGAAVTTTADPTSGDWSVLFADLPTAVYQVTASQTVAGTTSTPVAAGFRIVVGPGLEVLQPEPGDVVTVADATASTAVTVSGTAAPGATVRVDLGVDLVASTIADPTTGAWSVVVAGVTVGERTLTATQALGTSVSPAVTQPLSVVSAAAVVIEAPAVGTVVAVATPDATTDLVVSGTAEPGASIAVDLGDDLTGTVTADGTTGAWSVTVPGVPVGDRTIAVTQTVDGST